MSDKKTVYQCDQTANYFFNIWPFTTKKICPISKVFPKLGSQDCQLLNEPLKYYQRYLKFCQIGKISPNLATLAVVLQCVNKS